MLAARATARFGVWGCAGAVTQKPGPKNLDLQTWTKGTFVGNGPVLWRCWYRNHMLGAEEVLVLSQTVLLGAEEVLVLQAPLEGARATEGARCAAAGGI